MSDETKRCPKCKSAMEPGYLVDRSWAAAPVNRQVGWARGEAERTAFGNVRPTSGLDAIPNVTFRCSGCGYLESYAPGS